MKLTLLRKVRRDLMSRKTALAALVGIMAFGISGLVCFASITRDLRRARDDYFASVRMGDFYSNMKRAPESIVDEIAEMPNVREVRGRVNLSVMIDMPELPEPVAGIAISLPAERRPVINDVLLKRGTWFSGPGAEEVLVIDSFARANGLVPGSHLKVLLLDEQRDLLVIGTVMSAEFVYQIPPGGSLAPDARRFGAIYLEETFLQEAGDLDGAWNQIVGTVGDPSPEVLDPTLDAVEIRLAQYGCINAQPMDEQPSTKFLDNELENVEKSSFITPVIFLVVAALMLNVLVARLVQQQRVVIGTLKAVGYSSARVFFHYLCYGLAIGLAGGVAGSLLGMLMQRGMTELYRHIFEFPSIGYRFYPGIHLIAIGVSALAASVGTIKGTLAAVRLHPAEAMHPPPPERTHHTPLEWFPKLWRRLPFRWKMVFRAIFRNPFRSAVSVFAGIAATMLVLAAFAMRDALQKLMRFDLQDVSHQDLTVQLRDPRGLGFDSEERQFVGETEPQLVVPADLVNGPRSKTVTLTGIAPGNHLYAPLDSDGRRIPIPVSGIVMTPALAKKLGVGIGDELVVQPLIGERRRTTATVVAVADSYVGMTAYANIEYLSRMIGEEWSANAMLVKSWTGASDAEFLDRLRDIRVVTGASRRLRSLKTFEETFSKANATIIGIFIAFALMIGFGSILNASLVSLSERQREVAILRVLGLESRDIAKIFAGESLVLYGIGTILGVPAGMAHARWLAVMYSSDVFRFPVVLLPWRMWLTVLLMGTCIAVAQVFVVVLVSRLPWQDVLKAKE